LPRADWIHTDRDHDHTVDRCGHRNDRSAVLPRLCAAAHRTEARAALLALAAAQEKYYLQFNCYAAALDPTITASTAPTNPTTCAGGKLAFSATSERGYYDIAVTAVSLTDWTATATAVAGKAQAADTKCSVYQLTGTGIKSASTAASVANNDDCWRK
jgi:Tfp pilus assembly protein PilE